jgi:hypothetical protein
LKIHSEYVSDALKYFGFVSLLNLHPLSDNADEILSSIALTMLATPLSSPCKDTKKKLTGLRD